MSATSDSLKKQFQQLQEQQQKKLARRKQLKEGKVKTDPPPSASESSVSNAFGIDDDLDLKLSDPAEKKASIYSEDLVDHLNDQIRELKDETGRLYKLLSERDLEVRLLRKKQEQNTENTSTSSGITNETAATKIVDLSKKLREKTAELESEKVKGKQLAKKCFGLENELQNYINSSETGKSKGVGSTGGSKASILDDLHDRQAVENELKTVQDKLRQSETKMAEFRNQCQSLRQEIKMANKVISQEVGEGATIQSLMNNASNWRGRAQQIITLQKKVNELRAQVDGQGSTYRAGPTLEEEFLGSATSKSSRNTIEDRHKDQIRKMERERKEASERMANELQALSHDHETLKQKMEASKARNKVLSTELKSVKQQVQALLDKGKHDDELISALLKQQTKLKSAIEENTKSQESSSKKEEQVSKQLALKKQQENNVIEQLRNIVAEKEEKVMALEEEINQMRIQKAQMNGVQGMFEGQQSEFVPQSASSNQMSSYRPPSNPLTDRSSRPPSGVPGRPGSVSFEILSDSGTPTPQASSRLGSAASARSQVNSARPGSGTRGDRRALEGDSGRPVSASRGVDKRVIEELQLQCQEFKSMCQAATVERDRLSEFVKVLQKRIDEYTQKVTETQSELAGQRRKNTHLEKQLGKASIDQQGMSAKKQKSKTGSSSTSLRDSLAFDDDSRTNLNLEELETSLSIQRDENEALKMALQRTLESKEEDLRLYSEMVEETKQVFLQGLRKYRGGQS